MVIQARNEHLIGAIYIYRSCAREMNRRGLYNWNTAYPSLEEVQMDIQNGQLFLYREKATTLGVVCLNETAPDEYRDMPWKYSGPSLIVHRLAVDPGWRNMKIAEKLMDFAMEHARRKGYQSIRLDAITTNPQALSLYEKTGYEPVGHIHFEYQRDPFRCMERKVDSQK